MVVKTHTFNLTKDLRDCLLYSPKRALALC